MFVEQLGLRVNNCGRHAQLWSGAGPGTALSQLRKEGAGTRAQQQEGSGGDGWGGMRLPPRVGGGSWGSWSCVEVLHEQK